MDRVSLTRRLVPRICLLACLRCQVSAMYSTWLKKGVHVVTPNKKVGSGPMGRYKECMSNAKESGAIWGYEVIQRVACVCNFGGN